MANDRIKKYENDGKTYYYFTLYGKKHTRKKRAEAERLYRELKNEKHKEELKKELGKLSVNDFMLKWLDDCRGTVKETTYDRKVEIVNNQIIPTIGRLQVATLKNSDVRRMLNTLADEGYSYSTIKKAKEYLQQALRFEGVLNKFAESPFFNVDVPVNAPRKKKDDIIYYNKNELDLIYDTALSEKNNQRIYRLGPSIIVFAETGMRVGEFLALTWDDVDFAKKEIKISKTREVVKDRNPESKKKTKYVVTPPKSESSERLIQMSDKCYDSMQLLKEETGEFEYVLSSSEGNPITESVIRKMFTAILKRAGFSNITVNGKQVEKIYGLHSLRHSFATYLINEKGANIAAVSMLMGHSSIEVTMDKYVHIEESDKRKAIEKLNE